MALARVNSNVVRFHIVKVILIVGILFTVSAGGGGRGRGRQQNPGIADCPTVTTTCREKVSENSDAQAYAIVGGPAAKLKYHWTVTWSPGTRRGRIKSGQGTPSLVVFVPRRARGSLTMTVKVIDWNNTGCPNESSCSTIIAPK